MPHFGLKDGISWIVAVGSLIAAYGLTGVVRGYALHRGILDVPNARSSHVVVTPRGGGLAIAAVMMGAVVLFALRDIISSDIVAAISGGGLIVAGVGWIDDRRGLSATVRAAAHFVAALWALFWLGGLPSLDLGVTHLRLGWAGCALGAVGVVWLVNLYNFMDGIDGLAATEAITAAGTAALLIAAIRAGLLPNPGTAAASRGVVGLGLICVILASSAAGFLVWNWPPARIFMGDVGSGFLGFTFGVLAVASENSGALPLLVWILLLAVFVVDATATLVRRIRRGERWTEAHRTHAYQLAVQAGRTHKQVTLAVLAINIVLGAAATAACAWPRALLLVVVIAATLLVVLRARVVKAYEAQRGGRVTAGQHSVRL